jgi:class 3 adenylate cyclase/tetratricopeptide (TPR) repeat protein
MTCPRCQAANRDGARFCRECGATFPAVCTACGAKVEAGSKFCDSCGASLAATPPQPPETYTPKHLAERILTSKAALEGERKQVTVLFADLKGSMELLADRDPEEARKVLDPVLERMMEAVHHYEGTVNQVMGDGIMALFGAPVAHEDHAVRACYAALRMQRRVNLFADEVQQQGGTPVQIRVGVNSGEVVVRAIGSDLHMDYTAVGQTTHLAARMEQMAKPGSALITGATLNLAEGYVQVRPLGAVPVKGLETPTPVYELTGTIQTRSRLQASAVRGLSRFVGRDRELEQLGQALERAAAGHGQAVAVVGEAGVGKSRLAWEVTRSHRTHGWLVLESGSVSYGKATPYLPVIELLKVYCRIQERDEPRAIRERVAGKLLMLDRALEPLLTPLLALLDVTVEDAVWAALDPPQRRQRTLDAIKRLLLRESQVQPLLLIFEDLHWIDAETQALLDGLMESLPTARILLLVNYRPEYQHAWGGKTYYVQLRIDPLPPESADTLLTALLGEDQTLAPLKRVLIERTEGNPFFLEESVRTLVETQVLVGERREYRVTTAPDAWQIPATVQAILAARIDRLAPEDKRLLQAAAVIGKDVPFALLQAVAELSEDALRRGLAQLQAAELLYEARLFPDLEYTFKHALTHEVAYGSLLHDRRRRLHTQIAAAIEQLYPDRLIEQVDRLAHHAFRGELWDRAAGFLRQAGAKAAARSAYREAAAGFEQALVALRHLRESRERLQQEIDVRFDLRSSLQALGEHERVFEHLREAETVASALDDQGRLGWTSAYLSQYLWRMGDPRRAEELGQRALAIAAGQRDFALEAVANFFLGQGYFNVGDYRHAIDHCRRNAAVLTGDRAHERLGLTGLPSVLSRNWLVWSFAERGDFGEAMAYADEALSVAEAARQPYSVTAAHLASGQVHLLRGALAQAIPALERSVRLCRTWDLGVLAPTTASALGLAYAWCGRVAEALPVLEEGEARAIRHRLVDGGARERVPIFDTSYTMIALGTGYALAGRLDEAVQFATRVAQLAAERGFRGTQAWVSHLLGEISAHRDPQEVAGADEHYGHALALATELGMRPLVAHCHLGLGTLYRRTGDHAKATDHLTTAATMYREMGMDFWLEKADAELRGVER